MASHLSTPRAELDHKLKSKMANPKIIWQISDDVRGHENQSLGLIRALSRQVALEVVKINIATDKASWWQALRGKFPTIDRLLSLIHI